MMAARQGQGGGIEGEKVSLFGVTAGEVTIKEEGPACSWRCRRFLRFDFLRIAAFLAPVFLWSSGGFAEAQLVTEIYQTCTALQGEQARCGPGANCFLMNGVATCHCVVDVATGLPLAGNPYKSCTWDISGTWQLFTFYDSRSGSYREMLSPASNEPFLIRLDRTDAVLKTKYMTGAIFIITALTSFAMGICSRAFLDANDNTSIIFEQAEGFLDQNGRSILLRTNLLDTTIIKTFPEKNKFWDRWDMKGKWQKSDGSEVHILDMKRPHRWPNPYSQLTRNWSAYWYNDAGYGSPMLRLSMAIFLDKTLKPEKAAFNTNARFCQVGWYGALRFGSNRINIYSPADGKPIFTLMRIDVLPRFTPIGATAANMNTQFSPKEKEVIMFPSVNNFSISAKNPPEEPKPREDDEPQDIPISRPAVRVYKDDETVDATPEDRFQSAVAASQDILAGLPIMSRRNSRVDGGISTATN